MIERADKKKSIDKVAASLAKNPLQTEREIAKDTWLGNGTVNRAKKEVEQIGAKDDRIQALTDKDFDCIRLWVEEINRRLSDKEELRSMKATEISQVIKENTARYTLFKWNVTDDQWGMKELSQEKQDKLNALWKQNGID